MAQEDLRKKVDLAFLSAFYGGLLTEKQRRVLSLHSVRSLLMSGSPARQCTKRSTVRPPG